jgi:EAL domain-containing protein (putative c-di-GMP-specific phosphodiesterase class I)
MTGLYSSPLINAGLTHKGLAKASAPMVDPDHLIPHFQPIVHAPSGRIIGYEALARIRQGEAFVSAGQLFDCADYSASDRLCWDRHVRLQALEYFARHPEAGLLSFNISPSWIDQLGLEDVIPTLDMIEQVGIDPARVIIEINELSGSIENLERVVARYQAAGVRVAIDDFGNGASQIERLLAIKPDIIKLDMHLFKRANGDVLTSDFLLSFANMAQRSGCAIVCEGIETEEEYHFALECGAEYCQGWLFYKAMPQTIDSDDPVDLGRQLNQSYLKRKLHVAKLKQKRLENLKTLSRELAQWIGSDSDSQVDACRLSESGIIRFYLCDHLGQQVSPNFEVGSERLHIDQSYMGYSWSHRPFFVELLTKNATRQDVLVCSELYRDGVSQSFCRTLALPLNDSQLLLVDALDYDGALLMGVKA